MPGREREVTMKLHVVSAGAAQAVVEPLVEEMAACGVRIVASFGAVGAQRRIVLGEAPVDVVLLTGVMIEELIASGHVLAGSRVDLGPVCGGIAVCTGRAHPDVATPESLAACLSSASAVYIPDPAIATAGVQFNAMCARLGVLELVTSKLRKFPNGYAAMTRMAEDDLPGCVGYTQVTEIKYVRGVDMVAPVPKALQVPTVYSLGIASRASSPALAREFAARLAGPQAAPRLAAAGFGMT
jgi:molybdate transport system substrate-binding protein